MRYLANLKGFIIVLMLAIGLGINAQNIPQLSDSAEISLLTMRPGTDLYNAFGHSGIRINDPTIGFDWVYNYGTFNFNTDNFYLKFFKGDLQYKISKTSFDREYAWYSSQDRMTIEQQLSLTATEKQDIINFLEINLLPENKFYRYDFFFDNCATRIRDVFEGSVGEQLIFSAITEEESFRDLIDPYIKNQYWIDFGIDIILGLKADQDATFRQKMFLPDHLMNGFNEAILVSIDSTQPFVNQEETIIKSSNRRFSLFLLLRPAAVFWILFVLVLVFSRWQMKKERHTFTFDMLFYGILSLAGIVMLLGWVYTRHDVLSWNLNMIWACPFHVILVAVLMFEPLSRFTRDYFYTFIFINLLVLVSWIFLPQDLHHASIPIVLMSLIRSFTAWYFIKNRLDEAAAKLAAKQKS